MMTLIDIPGLISKVVTQVIQGEATILDLSPAEIRCGNLAICAGNNDY